MKSRTHLLPCLSHQASTPVPNRRTQILLRTSATKNSDHSLASQSSQPLSPSNQRQRPLNTFHKRLPRNLQRAQPIPTNSNLFHQILETHDPVIRSVIALLLRPLTKESVASTTRTASTPVISPQAQTQASPTLPRIEATCHKTTCPLGL